MGVRERHNRRETCAQDGKIVAHRTLESAPNREKNARFGGRIDSVRSFGGLNGCAEGVGPDDPGAMDGTGGSGVGWNQQRKGEMTRGAEKHPEFAHRLSTTSLRCAGGAVSAVVRQRHGVSGSVSAARSTGKGDADLFVQPLTLALGLDALNIGERGMDEAPLEGVHRLEQA